MIFFIFICIYIQKKIYRLACTKKMYLNDCSFVSIIIH